MSKTNISVLWIQSIKIDKRLDESGAMCYNFFKEGAMLSVGEIMGRENSLLQIWKGKGNCVRKFENLGVKIVQNEDGQCFLISSEGEGIFGRNIICYGTCSKKMSQSDALVALRNFCCVPIRKKINRQSQNDFDILLGFAIPTETVVREDFIRLLKNEIEDMKKQEQMNLAAETVEEKFNPLFKSIDMAVGVARTQPNTSKQVDKFFNSLGL